MNKMNLLKFRLTYWRENWNWKFWGWMMDHHPRLYDWCDKYLPFDTLPF